MSGRSSSRPRTSAANSIASSGGAELGDRAQARDVAAGERLDSVERLANPAIAIASSNARSIASSLAAANAAPEVEQVKQPRLLELGENLLIDSSLAHQRPFPPMSSRRARSNPVARSKTASSGSVGSSGRGSPSRSGSGRQRGKRVCRALDVLATLSKRWHISRLTPELPRCASSPGQTVGSIALVDGVRRDPPGLGRHRLEEPDSELAQLVGATQPRASAPARAAARTVAPDPQARDELELVHCPARIDALRAPHAGRCRWPTTGNRPSRRRRLS